MAARKVSRSSPIQAAVVRWTVRGFATLPLPTAQKLGAALGYLLWRIPNRLRRISQENIDRCLPELAAAQRRRLVKASLISIGKNVAEGGAMWQWPAARLAEWQEEIENGQLLSDGMETGRGVLLLVPHVGNWEFLSHFLAARYPFVSLYRPPRIAQLDAFISRQRERHGATMVSTTIGGLRSLAATLKAGGLTLILPDQEPLKRHGVFAPFFGTPALTMTLVGSLSRRLQPTVVYGFAERTPRGGFRIRFLAPPNGLDDPDPVRAAEQLNRGVERCVRACPEQYMWSYRRFRTRPPGSPGGRARPLS